MITARVPQDCPFERLRGRLVKIAITPIGLALDVEGIDGLELTGPERSYVMAPALQGLQQAMAHTGITIPDTVIFPGPSIEEWEAMTFQPPDDGGPAP